MRSLSRDLRKYEERERQQLKRSKHRERDRDIGKMRKVKAGELSKYMQD